VGAADQGHILLALADGQPGNPALAVRRTVLVWWRVSVEGDDTDAPLCQLPAHGRPHRADPDHDHLAAHAVRFLLTEWNSRSADELPSVPEAPPGGNDVTP
jgi:hypothetical protein